jgi:hypothetical protein
MERPVKNPGAERWLDAAMGWILSVGLHLVALLGAALMIIEQLLPDDSTYGNGLACALRDQPIVIDRMDMPRDIFDRKGLSPEDPLPPVRDEDLWQFPPGSLADDVCHFPKDSPDKTPADRKGVAYPMASSSCQLPPRRHATTEGGTVFPSGLHSTSCRLLCRFSAG